MTNIFLFVNKWAKYDSIVTHYNTLNRPIAVVDSFTKQFDL